MHPFTSSLTLCFYIFDVVGTAYGCRATLSCPASTLRPIGQENNRRVPFSAPPHILIRDTRLAKGKKINTSVFCVLQSLGSADKKDFYQPK